jgi:hypothetical protein
MRAGVARRLAGVRVEPAARLVAFACAAVLVCAYYAQRTQWTSIGGRRGNRLFALQDPNQWNLLVAMAGIVALAALVVGFWSRRWAVVAALVAGAAFVFAAFVAGSYRVGLPPAAAPPGGIAAPGSAWVYEPTAGPPLFVGAALLGAAASLVFAACRLRAGRDPAAQEETPWPQGDGAADSWIDRDQAARHGQEGWATTGWREPARAAGVRFGDDGAADIGLVVSFGCAVLLLPALFSPREWARTTWITGRGSLNDSPAGYVWLVSLCALAALVALAVAARAGRLRPVAALVAVVAFGYGAFAVADYALHLWSGAMGVEGRIDPRRPSLGEFVDAPELLPVFLLLSVLGAVGSLAAASAADRWPRRDPVPDRGMPPWMAGGGPNGLRLDGPGNPGEGSAR